MRISQNLLRVYNMLMRTPSSSPSSVIITIISSSWHLLYNFHRKISRMVRNNFMMHLCTVATLCFLEKTFPRNYYYSDQDDNSLSLCFKSMYLTLFVAIFTSNFIFSMSKSFHTYRNINIRDQTTKIWVHNGFGQNISFHLKLSLKK